MSDFYRNLEANENASNSDSEVSEVEPDQMASMLKGMDEMDNELFVSTLKTGLPVSKNQKSSSVKNSSQTATGTSRKNFDFDEDNPLAGLLSDEDDTPSPKRKTDNSEFIENKPKVGGSDVNTKSSAQIISPTNNAAAGTGRGNLSSGLDWLNTKPSDLNKTDNSSFGASGLEPSSFSELARSNRNKPQEEDILDLLNDDTKRPQNSRDKNSKRKFISDIFGEDTDKASPSTEATISNPTPPTRTTKGPSPGDWLGLKDADSSNLSADDFPTLGLPSGDVGRRPRTAAAEAVSRQETRPKTAAPVVPKPRQGRGDEQKTPQSILKSFMNDYESPTIPLSTLEASLNTESDAGQRSSYTPSAAREPRRGGRRSSLGLADPLGLFSNTQATQNIDTTSFESAPKTATDNPSRTTANPPTPQTSTATVTTNTPSSQLPPWLGGSATQGTDTSTSVSTSTTNPPQNQPAANPTTNASSIQPTIQVADSGPLLSSISQMEATYTGVMAQQMHGLTAALSLRRQEEAMAAMQMRQAALIRQYEQQLNELMQRQMQRQQQMEQTMSQQQEQIQKHIQVLISQPTNPHPFITHSQLFMPKQGNNELPSLPETQDSISELKLKILRLEGENQELETQIQKERKRYEERQYDLEEGYRKQVVALESLLEKQEKRMILERQEIEKETVERIARLKEEHTESSSQQAERMVALHAEWLSDLRRLGEFHKEAVEMLRSEQTSAIEHWNEMKTSELNLIRDSASTTQELKQALSQLQDSTESLQEIKSFLSQKINKQQQDHETALHERETQLTALQQTLDKEISNVASERANLTSLARELEERIAKQKEDSEKNFKAVEDKENAWRQEKEEVSHAMKEERVRLQELRAEAEAEIKRLSNQKAELLTEISRLEMEKETTEKSVTQRLQEIKKMEEEAKASLATAQEKAAEAKRRQEIAESEHRTVLKERTQCSSRAQELDSLAKKIQHDTMAAEEARAEGVAALAEARRLEREQADNAAELTRQIALLKEREQLLCQEKLSLSMEWKRLRDNRARGLCLHCSQQISSHQGNHMRHNSPKDFIDPLPIIMRLRAERGSDFSDFDLPDPVPSVLDIISQ